MSNGAARKQVFPLWQLNLLFFFLLVGMAVFSFFLHLRQVERIFLKHAKRDALLVANVVSINTEIGYLSQKILEDVLSHFLSNTASFLDYLETIEPFSYEELLAFVEENHLAGLVLKRTYGPPLVAPKGWFTKEMEKRLRRKPLIYWEKDNLFLYRARKLKTVSEIILAVRVEGIADLRKEVSLESIFQKLAQLPVILYVRLDPQCRTKTTVNFEGDVIQVNVPFRHQTLVVGLEAKVLKKLKRKLRTHFILVLSFLLCFGGTLTYLFYRVQEGYIARIREYERDLSLKREEAAIGRAAASIAHEIRNPLNTMSIALQRLLFEAKGLSPEHRHLIRLVLESVKRTNKTVEALLNYARLPQEFPKERLNLTQLVKDLLSIYQKEFEKKKARVQVSLEEAFVLGNRELLLQALENLFRNALEAIDPGGIFEVSLRVTKRHCILRLANTGDLPPPHMLDRLFEPYVTLKTRGTGLGLALVRRVILAHGGQIKAQIENDMFVIEIILPKEA